jgi:hypothetical protein
MNMAIQAREGVNQVMVGLTTMNKDLEDKLALMGKAEEDIDINASNAVRTLQYNDIVRQLAAYTRNRIDSLEEIRSLVESGGQQLPEMMHRSVQEKEAS